MLVRHIYHRNCALLACILIAMLFAATVPMSAGQLYSVAFKTNNPAGNSPLMSGPEAAATAANPAFGAANTWNNLFSPSLETNPSWSNLVDSAGTPGNVAFSVTGTVGPTDFFPWEPAPDPVRTAFLFWNSWQNGQGAFGPGESSTITWKLTGLQPNATYAMFFYGGLPGMDRPFDMTVGGITQPVWSYNDYVSHPLTGTLFATVYSNASGTISGIGAGIGSGWADSTHEADWSGFQIAEVSSATPEPSSLMLLGSGVLGLAGIIRRKLSL